MAAADGRIRVLHRAGKLGLGTAILTAMRSALEQGYDYLINMDADFSHHPRYLPAILAGMDRHDVMIGSRYVKGGGTVNWPWKRRLMSRGVNLLVRFLLRLPARDCSGAYRCYRVARLRQAQLERVVSRGYSFQQEVLYRCRLAHCRIGETPIVFEDRRAGSSKVNPREVVRSLSTLLWIGLRAFFGHDQPRPRTTAAR
jgi:dolichol-phosphate mannosyltransferase